jgi:hypothetical protein
MMGIAPVLNGPAGAASLRCLLIFLFVVGPLMLSVTISGLSVVVPEHPADPGESDRQSLAFGRGQSAQQSCVLGVQFLPDLLGRRLPVVGELESVEASIVLVPLS